MRHSRFRLNFETLEDRLVPAQFAMVTADQRLALVNSNAPGMIQTLPVQGLNANQIITGIDQRRSDGRVFAAVDTTPDSQYLPTFYSIDLNDGQAAQASFLELGGYVLGSPKRFEFGNLANATGPGEGEIAYTFSPNGGWDFYHFSPTGYVNPGYSFSPIHVALNDEQGTRIAQPDDMASVVSGGVAWLVILQGDRLYARPETPINGTYQLLATLPTTTDQRLIEGDTQGNLYLLNSSPDHDAVLSTFTLSSPSPVQLATIPLRGPLSGFTSLSVPINPNHPPRILAPDTLHGFEDTPLVFSSANNTAVRITDDAVADAPVTVSLGFAIRNGSQEYTGRYTLSTTQGLQFQTGDGISDDFMTFTGLLSDVNRALDGLIFTPTPNYYGKVIYQPHIIVDDLGSAGLGSAEAAFKNINIYLESVNDPLAAIADMYYQLSNTEQDLFVTANDAEQNPDGPYSEQLTIVEVLNNVNGATITVDSSGLFLHYHPRPGFYGTDQFQYRVTDPAGLSAVGDVSVVVGKEPFLAASYFVNGVATIGLTNFDQVEPFIEFKPFGSNYRGAVSVSIADVDGDGIEDIVAAQIKTGGQLAVFTQGGVPLKPSWAQLYPFGRNYSQGLEIAVADVNQDHAADIAVSGRVAGKTTVRVINGATGATISNFVTTGYVGSLRLALADLNQDGSIDLTTFGPNTQQGLSLKIFNPLTGQVVANTAAIDQANRGLLRNSLLGFTLLHGGLSGYALGIGNSFGSAVIDVMLTTRDGSELVFGFTGSDSTTLKKRSYNRLPNANYETRFVPADLFGVNQTAWITAPTLLTKNLLTPIIRTFEYNLTEIKFLVASGENARFQRGIYLSLSSL